MVRGKKSRISPLTVGMPSQTAVDTESDLSKHVAIMSGLSETEDRISKVCNGARLLAYKKHRGMQLLVVITVHVSVNIKLQG